MRHRSRWERHHDESPLPTGKKPPPVLPVPVRRDNGGRPLLTRAREAKQRTSMALPATLFNALRGFLLTFPNERGKPLSQNEYLEMLIRNDLAARGVI